MGSFQLILPTVRAQASSEEDAVPSQRGFASLLLQTVLLEPVLTRTAVWQGQISGHPDRRSGGVFALVLRGLPLRISAGVGGGLGLQIGMNVQQRVQ